MSAKNIATVPKNEPNLWPNNSAAVNTNSTNQLSTQETSSKSESELESKERLGQIFKRLDCNGNGRIDIHELIGALKGSGMPHQYAEVSVTAKSNILKIKKIKTQIIVPNSFAMFFVFCFKFSNYTFRNS